MREPRDHAVGEFDMDPLFEFTDRFHKPIRPEYIFSAKVHVDASQ